MIQVRDLFQLKFGRIDQAVELFKRLPEVAGPGPAGAAEGQPMRQHGMTDISGSMYTFITELAVPSMAEWEIIRATTFDRPSFSDWFKQYQLIVDSGRLELYTVEGEHPGWSRPGVVIVREVYRALKWQIRPTVALLQRYGALLVDSQVGRNPRILTDLTGEMFTCVIEIETDGLSDWETRRREMYVRPEFQVWFAQLSSSVEKGWHEFYRLEF
jgi:hypothetical protein